MQRIQAGASTQSIISSYPEKIALIHTILSLYTEAKSLLSFFEKKGFSAHSVVRIEEAYSENDDIVLSTGERIPFLRQQHNNLQLPCMCLSDYIIPRKYGKTCKIGLFACTVDKEMEESFTDECDKNLLAKTLADRLAEACIEKVHLEVRKNIWKYSEEENLSIADLLQGKYMGIRPAVGYPSLPDMSLNFLLKELLRFEKIGIQLTESGAMIPHASVSGFMIAHPQSQYFSVGAIGEDQIKDYAQRREMSVQEMKKFITNTQ